MSLFIRGGTVVTADGERRADVRIVGERIEEVSTGLRIGEMDEVIDAFGRYVFPGFIDPHVHTRDPGQTDKDDFLHVTRAAAAGGSTMVLVMPNAIPPVVEPADVAVRAADHARHAHVDFGLWALVFGAESSTHLDALKAAGAIGVKLFWGYAFDKATRTLRYDVDADSDGVIPPATTGDVWQLLRSAEAAGMLVGVHCEDHALVTTAARVLGKPSGPADLPIVRPAVAETLAVASIIELARATGARAHVLHLSTARAAELVRRAAAEDVPVTAESCPQYLALDPTRTVDGAAPVKIYPPPRGAEEADALWAALRDGTIASLSSDHAPHTAADRAAPYGARPAGAAGTETMVPVLIDEARRRGFPLPLLADRLSTGTARLYDLYPEKGSLEPGTHADVTIVDLEREWTIEAERLHSKDRQNPWLGQHGRGAAVMGIVRGAIVMRDGGVVGDPQGQPVGPHGRGLLPQA